MSIGQTIFIPDPAMINNITTSTPTPVPAPVTQAVCHPSPRTLVYGALQSSKTQPQTSLKMSPHRHLAEFGNGSALTDQIAYTYWISISAQFFHAN
ncbi:MAG: hypothetical protein U0Z26_10655 [Anaerolineales bacterium]